jgi:hypothetical protein
LNQQWLFDDGAWQIQYAADPTQCIDAGDMKPGTPVMLWGCNHLPQQKLGYDPVQGTIYLASSMATVANATADPPNAQYCLDTYAPTKMGNGVQVWNCNSEKQQQFDVLWGTTIRVNQNYKSCLDLSGGSATPGTAIEVWGCNGGLNQQWIFDPLTGAIMWGGNGGDPPLCIDSHDMSPGTNLIVWGCNGQDQQVWGYDSSMQTLYLTKSMATDLTTNGMHPFASGCMDLSQGIWKEGSGAVGVWNCNRCWNQQWILGAGVSYIGQDDDVSSALPASPAPTPVDVYHPLTCPPIPSPGPAPPGPPGPKPPAPPAPPAGTCKGGWPQFSNQAQLAADSPGWGDYMKAVYGSIPTSGYPMCIGDFWMFYDTILTKSGVTGKKIPASVGTCPTNKGKTEGQHYGENNKLSPPSVSWSWHPIPYQALSGMVEVIHRKDPWGDEHFGAWFFYAKGSGIWFNLGKTTNFVDHSNGYAKFKSHNNEGMCKAAAAQSYDSIQFTAHSDGGDYGSCRSNSGTHYLNREIVATKGYGENACAGVNKKGLPLKIGWQGAGGACTCHEGKNLNCAGVPTAEMFEVLWGRNSSKLVLV